MAVELTFQGWFECRLATDGDAFDEKRGGQNGWTFALPGEPDLDRIIRFQPQGAVRRWGAPAAGVSVVAVSIDGVLIAGHAMAGAAINLLLNPVFEGRNNRLAGNGVEPIFPFDLGIAKDGFVCRRLMTDAVGQATLVFGGGLSETPDLLTFAGITDVAKYRSDKYDAITTRLATEPEGDMRTALLERKRWLDKESGAGTLAWMAPADWAVPYDYTLNGVQGRLNDPDDLLPAIDPVAPWRAQFRCGMWDADILMGFVAGTVTLPTA